MADEKQGRPDKEPRASAAGAARSAGSPARKKKIWRNVTVGRAYVQSSFNNTIVSITDEQGQVIVWATAGGCGFKGTKKGTPFAAQVTADAAAKKAVEAG